MTAPFRHPETTALTYFWAFPSFAIGGAQRRFAALAEKLGTRAHHVVTAMDGDYGAEALLASGVSYTRCPVEAEKSGFLSGANINGFKQVLDRIRPDLLLTVNWGSIEWRLANRRLQAPHIHFEDGFGADEKGLRAIKRNIARRALFSRLATGHKRYSFVAPSQSMGEKFLKDWGVANKRLHMMPNGVDVARFAAIEAPGERAAPVIGAVGALRAEKRFDRLLRIFAEIKKDMDVRLLIVGDGPMRGALREQAAGLGISDSVEFAGAQRDVTPYLRRMDIYAVTSDTEQMPISVVEAMAAGLPVVASHVGDLRAMLADANRRFTHAPRDEGRFAASMVTLLRDANLRACVGSQNATKAAFEYCADEMAERYRGLFADAVA